MVSEEPYLSAVVTARNDNHGGNLLGRMQLFVNGLLEQCRRHNLPAELILVEWNPPADAPRLSEALSWPVEGSPCTVRVIEVPAHIHNRYKHAAALPVYQMIAKNVGIRRSRGRFVLATNIDLLFNHELMTFLAARKLDPNRMYRADRHDVPADVPPHATLDQQLEYCSGHRIRIHTRQGTRVYRDGRWVDVYPGTLAQLSLAWTGASPRKKLKGVFVGPILLPIFLVHRAYVTLRKNLQLHTNGCGDFTILARDAWFHLQGYPEYDMYSMHLDSLLCHAAHRAGYREQVLTDPMRVYHIEHGSGWTPEGAAILNARLAAAGIEQFGDTRLWESARRIRRNRELTIFNTQDWGLVREPLAESVISAGAPRPCPV
jgi:hypothetical protein